MSARAVCLLACAAVFVTCARAQAEDTAFYYGPDLPPDLLEVYDQVVVEPGNVPNVAALSQGRAALVAYVSVGELSEADRRPIDARWVLGKNSAWGSRVMDLTQPGYRRFVQERVASLWRVGYRRFFLDTLDSFAIVLRETQLRAAHVEALAQCIRELAQAYPEARFVLNRGFEVLPAVARHVHGVVAESLFDGWDAGHGRYVRVPEADRAWLVERLREVRERYRLPVTVIDYRPAHEREQARETAQRIAALGFAPWVCTGSITDVGVGALEVMPRRVLVVSEEAAQGRPGLARWLAPVLEYLGYLPDYRTPAALPFSALRGRYAGIISAHNSAELGATYEAWLLQQVQSGLRVAIFGELGFSSEGATARALGITAIEQPAPAEVAPRPIEWSTRDALIGFEAEPPLHPIEGVPLWLASAVDRHLELRTASGAVATAIATTSWGGLARSHVFAPRGLHGQRAWVLDPFTFLSQALALPTMPVPDVTTESGGRVALFAIDVEGAGQNARMRGRPLVSDALLSLLSAAPWPHALGISAKSDSADAAALQKLMAAPGAYADALPIGSTTAHGSYASLTQIAPLFSAQEIAAPIAADSSYLDGSSESYAFERVLGTFSFTDAPRRLRPIALHYHAYAASSPGGVHALSEIYAALAQTPLFAVRVSDYGERVHAFQRQALARDLRGDFYVRGGAALRSVRVPAELGAVELSGSAGVATEAQLGQGRYITFCADGPRRLRFLEAGQRSTPRPHLQRANGRIDYFRVQSVQERYQVAFSASALDPLVLRFAGLPPQAACALSMHGQSQRVVSDSSGRLELTLSSTTTGASTLTCPAR